MERRNQRGRRRFDGLTFPTVLASAVATTLALLVCLTTVLLVQSQTNRVVDQIDAATQTRDILLCDGMNVFRGYALLAVTRDEERYDLARELFHIRDCERQAADAEQHLVPLDVQQRFVRVLATGRRPVIRGGRVDPRAR